MDIERLRELHANPENPIARMILEAEVVGGHLRQARDRAEAAYNVLHPPPPEEIPPPPPYEIDMELTPAGAEWCRIQHAQHEHWEETIRVADQDPVVVEILKEYSAKVAAIWEKVEAIGGTVGRVPGLGRCPVCGAGGILVPTPLDHSRSSSYAVCTLNENHVMVWLPWGG